MRAYNRISHWERGENCFSSVDPIWQWKKFQSREEPGIDETIPNTLFPKIASCVYAQEVDVEFLKQ